MKSKSSKANIPKITKDDDVITSALSKTESSKTVLELGELEKISSDIMGKIGNNDSITELFPDIELSIQIIISSILSSNDTTLGDVVYEKPDIVMPNSVNNHIMDVISKHIEKNYKINEKLPTIIREAKFTKGSYIEAILPSSKVSEIVRDANLSVEEYIDINYDNGLGILGGECTLSLSNEELDMDVKFNLDVNDKDINISFSDDYKLLNANNEYLETVSNNILKSVCGEVLSTEENETSEAVMFDSYKVRDSDTPIIIKLPSNSVIPVHVTGNPEKHLGYFIILSEEGTPVDIDSVIKNNEKTEMLFTSYSGKVSGLTTKDDIINRAKESLRGVTKKDVLLKDVEKIYLETVKRTIGEKIKNGVYGNTAEVSDDINDVLKALFIRTLKNNKSRLLYLPVELVSYYAFEYRKNGTGKSVLEKIAMLASIRAMLLFSRLSGFIKSVLPVTKVSVELDENEVDKPKAIQKIKTEVMKSRRSKMPFGTLSIEDFVNWVYDAGFVFEFNDTYLSNTKVTTEDIQYDSADVDSEMFEKIEEYMAMAFGLTKEMIDSSKETEFATTRVFNNILFEKRIAADQSILLPRITENIQKLLRVDGSIIEIVTNIIKTNIKDIRKVVRRQKETKYKDLNKLTDDMFTAAVVKEYIYGITATLPKPDAVESDVTKEALDNYSDMIDTYLEMFISSEAFPVEYVGSVNDSLDSIKSAMRTVLLKNYMEDKRIIPELSEFLKLDNEGKPSIDLLEEFETLRETLISAVIPYLKRNNKYLDKVEKKMEKIGGIEENEDNDDNGNADESGEQDNGYPEDQSVDNTPEEDPTDEKIKENEDVVPDNNEDL